MIVYLSLFSFPFLSPTPFLGDFSLFQYCNVVDISTFSPFPPFSVVFFSSTVFSLFLCFYFSVPYFLFFLFFSFFHISQLFFLSRSYHPLFLDFPSILDVAMCIQMTIYLDCTLVQSNIGFPEPDKIVKYKCYIITPVNAYYPLMNDCEQKFERQNSSRLKKPLIHEQPRTKFYTIQQQSSINPFVRGKS